MDGIGADSLGQIDDLFAVEETFDRPRADQVGLVRFLDVDPGRIGFGVDGRGRDVQFAAGADNPHGDFTAIGHQNFLEHDWVARGWEPELTSGSAQKERVS